MMSSMSLLECLDEKNRSLVGYKVLEIFLLLRIEWLVEDQSEKTPFLVVSKISRLDWKEKF